MRIIRHYRKKNYLMKNAEICCKNIVVDINKSNSNFHIGLFRWLKSIRKSAHKKKNNHNGNEMSCLCITPFTQRNMLKLCEAIFRHLKKRCTLWQSSVFYLMKKKTEKWKVNNNVFSGILRGLCIYKNYCLGNYVCITNTHTVCIHIKPHSV